MRARVCPLVVRRTGCQLSLDAPPVNTTHRHGGGLYRQQSLGQVQVSQEDVRQEKIGNRTEESKQEEEGENLQETKTEQIPTEGGQRQGAGENEEDERGVREVEEGGAHGAAQLRGRKG